MLKVGSPQPQADMFPPMEDPLMQGGFNGGQEMGGMPPMDGQMPQDGMNDGSSEFNTNFDAGVDADEDSDPKKFIQQLTGKLSQSLRKYNENLPQPDVELSKYVAGMILKQSTEGLTDGDKKEIIDKVGEDSDNNGNEMPQMDNQGTENGEQPMMESINHRKLINELFQELTQNRDNKTHKIADRPLKNISYKRSPFTAPTMK